MFRARLRIRVGKSFTTPDIERKLDFGGREVTVTSHKRDQPLSEAKWLVLNVRELPNQEEAQELGARLRSAVILAGAAARIGVDAGQDQPTGWSSEEFARTSGFLEPGQILAPNIHGLLVLEDGDNVRFPLIEATGTVTADPSQFFGAVSELAAVGEEIDDALRGALIVFNAALMNSEPIAQLALCISVVEALGQGEEWSDGQAELVERFATEAEAYEALDSRERHEVAERLRLGLHKIGLRQGVVRVLTRLGLVHRKKEWNRIYGLRSGLFHGTKVLTNSEVAQLATDAVSLTGAVIFALAEQLGVPLPSVIRKHFATAAMGTPNG